MGISLKNASELLRHYHKSGLVRRKRGGPGRIYVYTPSKNTENQLRYWQTRLETPPIKGRLLPYKSTKPIKGHLIE
jgi:hypothetical protein